MKSILIICISILFSTIALSQTSIKHSSATVDKAEGIFVFLQCMPQADYEVLGTVKKTGIVLTGKPKEMYRILLRRAKKDYPTCEGIIFDDIDMDHATCIKFKND